MGFIELEEVVGKAWHRWIGDAPSYPRHPDAAVSLEDVRDSLAVFFRGLGGDSAVQVVSAASSASRHRLTFRQRLGLGREEHLARADLNEERLQLPAEFDCFPEADLNRSLYYWLTAFLAHADEAGAHAGDALRADVAFLSSARRATHRLLAAWPGLRALHGRLCAAVRELRPDRDLPDWEAGVEASVMHLLGAPPPVSIEGRRVMEAIRTRDMSGLTAPRRYLRFLPVPLWGLRSPLVRSSGIGRDRDSARPSEDAETSRRRLAARRRDSDQVDRRDPLILNRFEYLLSIAEMLNLSRSIEDDEPGEARKAAESLDELSLGAVGKTARNRLRVDLELAPDEIERSTLVGEYTYPEWDYTRGAYAPDQCRVFERAAADSRSAVEDWSPDADTRRLIRTVRRQFEALRPRRRLCAGQVDGDELDVGAVVRSATDLAATGDAGDRFYLQSRHVLRDFAVTVLLDASLSTDAWVEDQRVLDVEKEAVLALSSGLEACGDEHSILAFRSRSRRHVAVDTLKRFEEPSDERLVHRLSVLKPADYTRIGAAIRHAAAGLEGRGHRHRLILLLTDGKPNDADHYEGRFGIEDTRRAVGEARRAGLLVFGITVDSRARDYFPYLFGPGGFAVVGRLGRLPLALPLIYRQITG